MASIRVHETIDMDTLLGKLPIEMRGKALKKAVRKGGNVVKSNARKRAPKGDPNHHPEAKALRDTIVVKTKEYRNGEVHMAIVGPSWPAGAHGHLIESGHEVIVSRGQRKGLAPLSGGARVPGKEFLAPAVDSTTEKQTAVVIESIKKDIVKLGG